MPPCGKHSLRAGFDPDRPPSLDTPLSMGLLDTVKDQASAIAKSAVKNPLETTFRRAKDEG